MLRNKFLFALFLVSSILVGNAAFARDHSRSCSDVGWYDNYSRRDCVAGYRNADDLFYDDARRYHLRNCMIHVDHSGDRFYFCDLSR